MPLNYRRAVESDAEILSRFGAHTYTETFGYLYPPAELATYLEEYTTETYLKWTLNSKYGLWVALSDEAKDAESAGPAFQLGTGETIVGYLLCGPCGLPHPEATEANGEVKKLYVAKSVFGTGVAATLFNLGAEWLKSPESGLQWPIYIGVWSENWRAHGFYMKKLGYVKCGEYDYKVGKCVDREWILREPESAWQPSSSSSSA